MRKKREVETDEERILRLRDNDKQRREEVAATDRAVEEMIRKSIDRYGP